jgi:hypothetical protein
MEPADKPRTAKWIAYSIILLGILCIPVGIAILSWTPKPATTAANAEPAQIVLPLVGSSPLSTLVAKSPLPTATATRVVAPTRTLPPQVTPETPTPVPLADGLFHLSIVHTNDTWGYTLPCG